MKFVASTFALVLGGLTAAACSQTVSQTGSQTGSSSASPPAATAKVATPEAAASGDIWRVMVSPYTLHYHYSVDHRSVYMFGLEKQRADGLVIGGSWFRNSFGQPSAYVYAGHRFRNFTPYEPLFAQLTAGVLYGYKPPFENKVPLNHNGFSPGAVLSFGWQFTPMISTQVNLLGNSAMMFQLSADFR